MLFRRRAAQAEVRSIVVAGRQLRVAVRHGDGTRAPLLLFNGIGASLDLLQPFVDALDPSLEVIRFDVPGVGGSPLPAVPYRFSGLCRLTARLLDTLGYGGGLPRPAVSLGGGAPPPLPGPPRPPGRAGGHGGPPPRAPPWRACPRGRRGRAWAAAGGRGWPAPR